MEKLERSTDNSKSNTSDITLLHSKNWSSSVTHWTQQFVLQPPPLRWNFPEGAMDADGAGAGAGGAGAGAGGAGAGGSGSAGKNSWPLIACTAQNLISLPHHNCLLQKLINFKPPPRHRPHQKSIIRGRWYTICLLALLAKHRSGFKFSYKVPNNV